MKKEIKIFEYNGSNVTFSKGDSVMVNATEMAKPFGKLAKDWLANKSTTEFLTTLSSVRGIPLTQLVVTKRGNTSDYEQGTWMHEDVAIEFARWLSPMFGIWCNDRVKELLTNGVVNRPMTQAEMNLSLAQVQVEQEQKIQALQVQQNLFGDELELMNNNIAEIKDKIRDNGFISVMRFANNYKISIGRKVGAELGRMASRWCKQVGVTPEKVKHERWGMVNTYPTQALKEVFKVYYPSKAKLFDIPTIWN